MCEPASTGSRQRSVSLHVWADCLPSWSAMCPHHDAWSRLASVGESTAIEILILAYA